MAIFDRVKDTVGLAGVSQKVSYATSTMKLNNLIKLNEKEIERVTYTIGELYVQRHLDNTDTEYEEELAKIRQLREEIHKFTDELEKMKAEQEELRIKAQEEREAREQARRQEKELQRERELQTAHAASQQEEPVAEAATGKICPNCDSRNDEDASFCTNCGTPMDT